MPNSAYFGSVLVEAVGFEAYPSSTRPTLRGYSNQVLMWELPFDRDKMWIAWNVFVSFLTMATEANNQAGKAEYVQSVGQTLATMQSWFDSYLNDLRASNAPADEQQAVQSVLNDLSSMRSKLSV